MKVLEKGADCSLSKSFIRSVSLCSVKCQQKPKQSIVPDDCISAFRTEIPLTGLIPNLNIERQRGKAGDSGNYHIARDYLGFRITQKLEMVVQRSHLKDTLAMAELV